MIVGVVVALAKWDMYKKAGEPGWKSVIPIYDKVVLFHLVGESGWLAALLFVPFVKFFVKGFLYYKLARCFGYSFSFMLGLLFMPFIFFPILGFGKCQYKKVLPFEQGG